MARFVIAALALGLSGCAGTSHMVVTQPVVHVRSAPRTAPRPGVHDPGQETQLLYGERVRVVSRDGDWAQIEALEQAEYTHGRRWRGYPGWVPAGALAPGRDVRQPTIVVTAKWAPAWQDAHRTQPLPLRFPLGTLLSATDFGGHVWLVELPDGSTVWLAGSHARALREVTQLPVARTRRDILRAAEQFLDDPYVWGGRSPFWGQSPSGTDPGLLVTGVDCSGLVNLAYRAVGIALPRDAHEQYLRAIPVASPQPADLIFLSSRDDPSTVVHVMLYAGNGELIEGPGTGRRVHRVRVAQRLGRPLDQVASGDTANGQSVFFGTYLP